MPNLMPVGTIVECRAVCFDGNQYSQNVRHYLCTSITGTGGQDSDMLTLWNTFMAVDLKALIGTGASYYGSSVQIIKPARLPAVFTKVGAGAGTGTGNLLAPQTAGLIGLKTNVATRKGRGRLFVPFPSAGFNNATGTPSAGYIALLAGLAIDLLATQTAGAILATSNMIPVLYSRSTGGTIPITRANQNAAWATIRRRSFVGRGDSAPF